MQRTKDTLFPCRTVRKIGKKGQELKTFEEQWDAPFNPRSPKQVIDWFKGRDIFLESTEKDDIVKAMDDDGGDA
jgi:hypothetical protein